MNRESADEKPILWPIFLSLLFFCYFFVSSSILSNELNEADTGLYEVGARDLRFFLFYLSASLVCSSIHHL